MTNRPPTPRRHETLRERPGGNPTAGIATTGGSGFCEPLEPTHRVGAAPRTAPPPDAVTIGTVDGRAVAFLPGHGAVHVSFADPCCETGRTAVLTAGSEDGEEVHDGGVTLVVEGPRLSPRAE